MKTGNLRVLGSLNDVWQRIYSTTVANAISNADIDDEDMAVITDWTDGDAGTGVSTQETFDSKSCMKLDSGGTNGGYANRNQDIGTFGARSVFSISIYLDSVGTAANSDLFELQCHNGTYRLVASFYSDGLYIYNSGTNVEVGANLTAQDVWQEWTFDVNWTTARVDVYLNGGLVGSNIDCSLASATASGTVSFQAYRTTAQIVAYINWFKAGSDFTVLQSGQVRAAQTSLTISGLGGNLLQNSDFETWSAGSSAAPDGWTITGTGSTVAREGTEIKIGTYSAKVVSDSSSASIYQLFHTAKGIAYWKGRKITFSCLVKTAGTKIGISDGVDTTLSSAVVGAGFELLTVTATIGASATQVGVFCYIPTNSTTSYFDGAMCVEGTSVPQTSSTNIYNYCLNGDTDVEYMLKARIVNGANDCAYGLRFNNDTGSNYGVQWTRAIDTVVAAYRGVYDQIYIGACADAGGGISMANIAIYAKSGLVRTALGSNMNTVVTTTVTRLLLNGWSWNNTADNITSFVILSDKVGGLGIGTQIDLFRRIS
jgi:hypothetical protein